MAKILPLPKLADLPEVVVLHREHPTDRRIMLQVPTSSEEAETYVIRMDQADHKQWLDRLPNAQAIKDRLAVEKHVAYYPHRAGTVMTLEDPYEIPWVAKAFAHAHASKAAPFANFFARRRTRHRTLPRPSLKQSLMQQRASAQW